MNGDLKDVVLSTIEAILDAQLSAAQRLGYQPDETELKRQSKSMSQVDMAFDILARGRSPVRDSEIIDRIQKHFDVSVDRENLARSPTRKSEAYTGSAVPASDPFASS